MENDSAPPQLAVGVAYNVKKGVISEIEDIEAEYDSFETIESIKNALESAGAGVELMEADEGFIGRLREKKVDIVFNIAEGKGGRSREAQVPAILDFMGIPFSGSDATTLCMALDKALAKRYLSTFGIRTPSYQLVKSPGFELDKSLEFPLIVKPNFEGSSKGISDLAVVFDENELRRLVEKNFMLYGQPMLIEEYVHGREFTVGLLGNGNDLAVFEPMEICYLQADNGKMIYSYNVKRNFMKYIAYSCPPRIEAAVAEDLKETAAKIFTALDCRDFSRVDFRLSEDGTIYFIEINPLPGLAPGYSDYPMMAGFCGVDYQSLIVMVLNSALKRYGMGELKVK